MATGVTRVVTDIVMRTRFSECTVGVRSRQYDLFEEPAIESLFRRPSGTQSTAELAGVVRALEAGDAAEARRRLERVLEEMEPGWRSMW